MFLDDPSDGQQWFLVPTDRTYATAWYNTRRQRVYYTFEIYGRMLQAMIEGYDEIQVQIAKKKKFSFQYFKGNTPDDVENAAVGFVQNVTTELEALEKQETIAESFFPISRYVPDELISKVGSGIINENNYTNYLEQIDVITATEVTQETGLQLSGSGLDALASAPENVVPSLLTNDLYENNGIFPGRIHQVSFPRQCELDRESGSAKKRSKKYDNMLKQYPAFRDLYSHFFSINSNQATVTSLSKEKPEFQKIKVRVSWKVTDSELLNLMYEKRFLLRLSLRKAGIEFAQENFSFENDELFVRLSSRLRSPRVNLVVNDPILALPDTLVVSNPNKFAVDVKIDKFIPDGDEILKRDPLAELQLASRETKRINSDIIHYASSETRGYTLTANRSLGGLPGVSNVKSIRTPPEIMKPSIETIVPQLTVTEGDTGVGISLSGLPEVGYTAVLHRRELGMLQNTVMNPLATGNWSWSDNTLLADQPYFYTAEVFQNDAIGSLGAEAPALWSTTNETSGRLNFSIVNARSQRRGNNISHSFKITQTTTTTTAEQMLVAVNEAGEAGDYSTELESERTDTSIVVDYFIYRYNKNRGTFQYLKTTPAQKTLAFTVPYHTARHSVYYVIPRVSGAAAISYLTVTSETDEATGQTYSLRYKKWREPGVHREEVLPSQGEVLRNDVKSALLNAPRGTIATVDLSANVMIGRVRNVRAMYDPRLNANFVMWEFSGTLSNIAYFVIMANYNGVKAPIGIAIPDGRRRRETISYRDKELGGAFGVVRYSIIPITIKGNLQRESRSRKVKNMSTYPPEALLRV